jgi:spore germination protein GerM
MKGPTDEEKRLGLISLIPEETQIISAKVLKDTAYIDVSEPFQYNIYGIEGYAGQLTQLIWTATEFSNVKNIQVLIEGRRVDYLGEGIWIGSPIDRGMF